MYVITSAHGPTKILHRKKKLSLVSLQDEINIFNYSEKIYKKRSNVWSALKIQNLFNGTPSCFLNNIRCFQQSAFDVQYSTCYNILLRIYENQKKLRVCAHFSMCTRIVNFCFNLHLNVDSLIFPVRLICLSSFTFIVLVW